MSFNDEEIFQVELFLFFTNLVHQYKILPENEGELPVEGYQMSVTLLPKPFKARLTNRL